MSAHTSPLRRRRTRRATVAAALLITAVLGSLLLDSLHGFGMLLVIVLAALDVLLIETTDGLAFTRRRHLDEREATLRDLAYRRGFRLLGLAAVVGLILLIASGIVSSQLRQPSAGGFGTAAVSNGITGRAIVVVVELLLMTPTMLIAWTDGDREPGEAASRRRRRRLTWLAVPALLGAWLLLLTLGAEQAATAAAVSSVNELQGATCAQFAGGRIVGAEFGATVGMRAQVCWNGHDAFVFGNTRIPLPRSAIEGMLAATPAEGRPSADDPNLFNADLPDLSGCGVDNSDDFATVSSTTCTGTIDSSGTLHYSVRAVVSGPLGVGGHEVTLSLVVDRNGSVLQRP